MNERRNLTVDNATLATVLGLCFVCFRKSPGSTFAINRDSAIQR